MEFKDLKRCTKCLMPQTVDGITFDANGICNFCLTYENQVKSNFIEREEELIKILDRFKGQGKYDCLVPFSGGKDSTYVLYLCKKYGLKPLAYNFNNHFQTKIGQANFEKVLHKTGTDLVQFTPNWNIVRRLCQKGIKRNGDFCWFCNSAIYASVLQRAIIEKIPLIVYGEADIGVPLIDSKNFELIKKIYSDLCQHGVSEKEYVDEYITLQDLSPYLLPEQEDYKKLATVYLSSFVNWDKDEIQKIISREYDWQVVDSGNQNSNSIIDHIDCRYAIIKEYLKFLKRGYGINTSNASEKIRKGDLSRTQAQEAIILDSIEPSSLDDFLKFIDLSREEFMVIINQHKKY